MSGAEFALVAANVASKPANYSVPAGIAVDGEITAKEVTVGAVTLTKTYDNTDTTAGAVISGGAVGGAAAGESFTLALASDNDGTYDSVDAASGIGVSGADFALAGADAGSKPANYQLPTSISVSGVIAPKTVAVADVTLQKPMTARTRLPRMRRPSPAAPSAKRSARILSRCRWPAATRFATRRPTPAIR